jgi:hypothetical protein
MYSSERVREARKSLQGAGTEGRLTDETLSKTFDSPIPKVKTDNPPAFKVHDTLK